MGPEKVRFARLTQCFYALEDSLCLCQFVYGPSWQLYGPQEVVALVRAATGWDVDMEELLLVGERRVNLMRAFNAREGIGSAQDRLADKFYHRALQGGPTDGRKLEEAVYETARAEYYRQCGWDHNGVPTRATLVRLGLHWAADMLPPR
jgi:aldehyde:ferredoxin oxidoreductase